MNKTWQKKWMKYVTDIRCYASIQNLQLES